MQLLAAAPRLRVAVVTTGPELEAVCGVRYQHVIANGWAPQDELRDGLERDAHDAVAVRIGAWDGDALIGTVRLVFPAPGRRLPVEEDFDLTVHPPGEVVEVGRLVIAHEHRGDSAHRAWGALFARAWLSVRARGLTVLAGAASAGLVERMRAVGLPFEILGTARPHWGQQRHPVRLDPGGSRPGWFEAV
jgi:hypothetical protein